MTAPVPPVFPHEVQGWIEKRVGPNHCYVIADLRVDAPPHVREWLDRLEQYHLDDEAHRKTLPWDADRCSDRIRFFGGPWLRPYDLHHALIGDEWVNLLDLVIQAPPERQRAIAAAIYERESIRAAGDRVVLAAIRGGT